MSTFKFALAQMRPNGKTPLRGPYGVDAVNLLFVDIDLTAAPFRADGCVP